jgi:hypothetical protein
LTNNGIEKYENNLFKVIKVGKSSQFKINKESFFEVIEKANLSDQQRHILMESLKEIEINDYLKVIKK